MEPQELPGRVTEPATGPGPVRPLAGRRECDSDSESATAAPAAPGRAAGPGGPGLTRRAPGPMLPVRSLPG